MNNHDINTNFNDENQDYTKLADAYNKDNKRNAYNNMLTVVLAMIVTAILIVIILWAREYIQSQKDYKSAQSVADQLIVQSTDSDEEPVNSNQIQAPQSPAENTTQVNTGATTSGNATSSNKHTTSGKKKTTHKKSSGSKTTANTNEDVYTYKGFPVIGTIEIPSIKVKYPVLDRATDKSLKASIGIAYGPGTGKELNLAGNAVLMGHNYRNGKYFSNLKNVKNGDKIFITDLNQNRIEYTVYKTYTTSSVDFDYAQRDTNGKREITLSSCTDDVQSRVIVWAKED